MSTKTETGQSPVNGTATEFSVAKDYCVHNISFSYHAGLNLNSIVFWGFLHDVAIIMLHYSRDQFGTFVLS